MALFGDIFSRITTTLQSQFTAMTNFIVQLQNWGTRAAQIVQQKVQKFVQTLLKPPRSKKDYWYAFGLYFSKRFVIMSTVVIGVLGYFFIYYAYPWAEGKLWTANMRLDTTKYLKFNGKARVYDTNNILVFEGTLEKGSPNGYGTQYDSSGKLLYKGNFQSGKYGGEGELYNSDGVMLYKGAFANNNYDGEGKLYNDIGKIIYVGSFSVGQRSGNGIEYNPDTKLRAYYGSFSNDLRNGNGVEYESDGSTIKYEGAFKDGVYGGTGKLYSGGVLLYIGNFSNGNYEGTGNLYDLDTGILLYSGEFKDGLYDGAGTLYDVDTSVVIYEGDFSKGKKQGSGTSYDSLGSESFSGTFRSDSIDYIAYLGKSPDDVTKGFGQESYRTEVDGRLVITYLSLDASVVFKVDSNTGSYVCEKIILGTKEEFMGLGANSTAVERRAVMGEPFSSINYSCADYYKTVFANLAISVNDVTAVPSDKYILNTYFIRFYFNEGRTELKCIEICTL